MKILRLIDFTNGQQELSSLLLSMEQETESTFDHVMGQGNEAEGDAFVYARKEVVGYIPPRRFGLRPKDDDVEAVLTRTIDEQNNITSQCFYRIIPVEKAGNVL